MATPSVGESIDIRFTPLAIRRGKSGFANVVEFWLDRGPEDNGIAMGLDWRQGDTWGLHTFTPADGLVTQPGLLRIEVGGDFHTVTIGRGQGFTEWFLDGDSLVVISKTRRTVYTRVKPHRRPRRTRDQDPYSPEIRNCPRRPSRVSNEVSDEAAPSR